MKLVALLVGLAGLAVAAATVGLNDGAGAAPEKVDADVEILGVTVSGPASAVTGAVFEVAVKASARNNGPAGVVAVPIDYTLSAPPDCKKTPGGPLETETVSLAVGAIVPLSKSWSLNCFEAGAKEIAGTAQALAAAPGFDDVSPGNNFGRGTASVAVTAGPGEPPAAGGPPAASGGGGSLAMTVSGAIAAVAGAAAVLGFGRRRAGG